jgi:hypothetical protein
MLKGGKMGSKDFELSVEQHKSVASNLFNQVWDLMDKKSRTPDENEQMLNTAHASWFHWNCAGTPLNMARAEWQLSRVYRILGRSEPAIHHAQNSLAICLANHIGDFDLAFAYEALAWAHKINGDKELFSSNLQLAQESATLIQKKEDKIYFLNELKAIQ